MNQELFKKAVVIVFGRLFEQFTISPVVSVVAVGSIILLIIFLVVWRRGLRKFL